MRVLGVLLTGGMLLLVAGLACLNAEVVTINYAFGQQQWPVAVVVLVAWLCGACLTAVLWLRRWLCLLRQLRAQAHTVRQLQRQLSDLRAVSISEP